MLAWYVWKKNVFSTQWKKTCQQCFNCARCTQARKATHGLDGQHQDVDRIPSGRVNQNDRGQG